MVTLSECGFFGAHWLRRIHRQFHVRQATANRGPVFRLVRVLERAVPDHLGVNAAVRGTVNVFEEDAPKCGTDRVARLIDMNGKLDRTGRIFRGGCDGANTEVKARDQCEAAQYGGQCLDHFCP